MFIARHPIVHRNIAVNLAARTTVVTSVAVSASSRHFSSTRLTMGKLTDAIKDDHAELEEFYHKTLDAQTSADKDKWRNQLTWELARHAVGEELVLYPAMEKYLPNGKELADHDRQEHAKIKETLYKFQSMDADDAAFAPTLKALWNDLGPHNKEEETNDLPPLEQKMSADDSAALATSFERCKMFAPTRGHPGMSQNPPFETVAALMTAPVDKLRDLFKTFPPADQT